MLNQTTLSQTTKTQESPNMQVESRVSFGDRNGNRCQKLEGVVRKYALFLYTSYRAISNYRLYWLLQNLRCHPGGLTEHLYDRCGQRLPKRHLLWVWLAFRSRRHHNHHHLRQLRLLEETLHPPQRRLHPLEPQLSGPLPHLHTKIQKAIRLLIPPQLPEHLLIQPQTVSQRQQAWTQQKTRLIGTKSYGFSTKEISHYLNTLPLLWLGSECPYF